MATQTVPDAWVTLPTADEVRANMPAGIKTPYSFEFLPNMTRLLLAHARIGKTFRSHFVGVMFDEGILSRREKEMVAGVAAAAQDCLY